MAIKISGTTVVNNSRQLQNIASLDSTTTSTIAAAAGGGTKILIEQNTLVSSGTFTAPYTGDYRFILIGGGGGGWSSNTGGSLTLSGASAAGVVIFDTSLSANASFSFTIGAGGDTPSGTDRNGVAGGTSSCTINGTSLSAGGGGAGVIGTNPAAGGTASGGGINLTGGTPNGANGSYTGLTNNDYAFPLSYQHGASGDGVFTAGQTSLFTGGFQPNNYGGGGMSSTVFNGHPTLVDGKSGCLHYICYVEA